MSEHSMVSGPCVDERRVLRRLAGAGAAMPVMVVDGDAAPRVCGESYYWTTPSGKTRVHHPNAYGWRTLYWPSTLRVDVGRDWLVAWRLAGGVFAVECAHVIAARDLRKGVQS